MRRHRLLLPLALAGILLPATIASAAPRPAVEPGEAIVKFRETPRANQVAALDAGGARVQRWLPMERTAVVRVVGANDAVLDRLESDPRVAWAEPNYVVRSLAVPNDARFADQWGLLNGGQTVDGTPGTAGADIGITSAWNTTTGADHVSVAIVDGGVELTHPDLAPNMTLTNPGESGGGRETNGRDDDDNGLVDDVRGWDWVSRDNDPSDLGATSHGSIVAGVIGARGNDGTGIAGALWRARMMSLRVLNEQGAGSIADVASAFAYAGSLGVRIVNASLGGSGLQSQALNEAVSLYPDTLYVFAAGNNGTNNDGGASIFPCDLPYPNVLCVAATTQNDDLAPFSNFGASSVDIAAPGENITGTIRGGGYTVEDGTSFAAPLASGVAGLVLAANPSARTAQIRSALINGATPLPSLAGRVASGGRLNAPGALGSVPPAGAPPGVNATSANRFGPGSANLRGIVTPTDGPASVYIEYGLTTDYGMRSPVRRAVTSGSTPVAFTAAGLAPDTRYHYRLVATDLDGQAISNDATLLTAPGRTGIGVKVRGRDARLKLKLARQTTIGGTLLRRTIVTRKGKRRATFVRARRIGARVSAAGRLERRIAILPPGRYRVKLRVVDDVRRRNITRSFRVAPKRPRVAGVGRKGRARIVNLRLFSRAKISGRVERLRGGRFVRAATVRRRGVGAGRRRVALSPRLPRGRYRVVLVINEGGRKTIRRVRLRV